MSQQCYYVGIDVAKDRLGVAIIPSDENDSMPYSRVCSTELLAIPWSR